MPTEHPASTPALISRTTSLLRARWTFAAGIAIALTACGGEGDDLGMDTGFDTDSGSSVASGGAVGSGGATGAGGGSSAAAGGSAAASGGSASGSGGAPVGTGGQGDGSGGMANGAGGGAAMSGGGPGAGGSGTGGGTAGTCEKGTTKGNEVLFIGESFVQASTIPEETTKLAIAAGSLEANDAYVDKSISGTWIGNGASGSIPNQYKNNSSGVRFVLMNGGGNDCWQGGQQSDRTNALNAAKQLFQDMDANGVEKIVYFFYPDPIGAQFANLTACLDLLRPEMKKLCDEQGSPKCYWLDLRDTWDGHPEYTSDGIHVAGPGNAPTAAAIFKTMQDNCVAP